MAKIATIEQAIADIAAGKMVILVDDEDRENEGDLVCAAELVTAEQINFMATEARGLICLSLSPEMTDALKLQPMARQNTAPLGTAFTVSIDHRDNPGIGAAARAAACREAVREDARPDDFVSPGHLFPLRARRGGVLVRSGQTEGSVDLARLAGLRAGAVICELMGPDGSMARLPKLLEFGERFGIHVVTVADLIRYRLEHERLVKLVAKAQLPTDYGPFDVRVFENTISGQAHIALTIGDLTKDEPTLVRVHRADTVADVFGLDTLPVRNRLTWSLQQMAAEGRGVCLYLRPDGVEEQLDDKVRMYGALARGERLEPGMRAQMGFHDFGVGAQILRECGLSRIRVLTRQPRNFKGLSGFGLEIVDWVKIQPPGSSEPTE